MRKVAKKVCKLSLFSQFSAPIKSGVIVGKDGRAPLLFLDWKTHFSLRFLERNSSFVSFDMNEARSDTRFRDVYTATNNSQICLYQVVCTRYLLLVL